MDDNSKTAKKSGTSLATDLLKALPSRLPESAAAKLKNHMFTASKMPLPIKAQQSTGVFCPTCGKHHKSGTLCDFKRSIEVLKANKTGDRGHNPYRDASGHFSSRDEATITVKVSGQKTEPLDKTPTKEATDTLVNNKKKLKSDQPINRPTPPKENSPTNQAKNKLKEKIEFARTEPEHLPDAPHVVAKNPAAFTDTVSQSAKTSPDLGEHSDSASTTGNNEPESVNNTKNDSPMAKERKAKKEIQETPLSTEHLYEGAQLVGNTNDFRNPVPIYELPKEKYDALDKQAKDAAAKVFTEHLHAGASNEEAMQLSNEAFKKVWQGNSPKPVIYRPAGATKPEGPNRRARVQDNNATIDNSSNDTATQVNGSQTGIQTPVPSTTQSATTQLQQPSPINPGSNGGNIPVAPNPETPGISNVGTPKGPKGTGVGKRAPGMLGNFAQGFRSAPALGDPFTPGATGMQTVRTAVGAPARAIGSMHSYLKPQQRNPYEPTQYLNKLQHWNQNKMHNTIMRKP